MKLIGFVLVGLLGLAHAGGYTDPNLRKQRRAESARLRAAYSNSNTVNLAANSNTVAVLPKEWNWCSTPDGQSLCSPSWNQHIPQYCGSCYLHATLTTLQDRYHIMHGGKIPHIMLSRQTFLNCAPFHNMSNGCDGGEGYDVFKYMMKYGLPDESCNTYDATDYKKYGNQAKNCPVSGYCKNCMAWGPGNATVYGCWGIKHPVRYVVKDYAPVPRGVDNMMMEIYHHGPIVCGFISYDDFSFNYRGGVWKGKANTTELDHDVEVVGWGETKEDGKFWVIRNSWGTFWGVMGFFKIPRGENALGIEEDCWTATLVSDDERKIDSGKETGSMYGIVHTKDEF